MPPEFDGHTLSYVDLDIDVLVRPDFSCDVLDMDDFEINASRYQYPLEVKDRASQAVSELLSLVAEKSFPFNQ